jgi:cyclopropane fatty-acyl-phospholipid synthase-like methyltransferase
VTDNVTHRGDRPQVYQPDFWKEEGGARWTANIETVERQIANLSHVLLDRAAAQPGETVLDVGCGGGVTSKELADRVGPSGRVLGVDVSAFRAFRISASNAAMRSICRCPRKDST